MKYITSKEKYGSIYWNNNKNLCTDMQFWTVLQKFLFSPFYFQKNATTKTANRREKSNCEFH